MKMFAAHFVLALALSTGPASVLASETDLPRERQLQLHVSGFTIEKLLQAGRLHLEQPGPLDERDGKENEEPKPAGSEAMHAQKLGERYYFIEMFKPERPDKNALVTMVVGNIGKIYGGDIEVSDAFLMHGYFEIDENKDLVIFHENNIMPIKFELREKLHVSVLFRDGIRLENNRGLTMFSAELGAGGLAVDLGDRNNSNGSPIRLHAVAGPEFTILPVFSPGYRLETGVRFLW